MRMTAETADTWGAFEGVHSHAAFAAALDALAAAIDRAVTAGRVAPAQAPRATGQLAKARRALDIAPFDLTTLLVHLTVARTFLAEGGGPPPLAQALGAAIARVHQLARTAPEVFRDRPAGAAPAEAAETRTPRLLP